MIRAHLLTDRERAFALELAAVLMGRAFRRALSREARATRAFFLTALRVLR